MPHEKQRGEKTGRLFRKAIKGARPQQEGKEKRGDAIKPKPPKVGKKKKRDETVGVLKGRATLAARGW